MHNEIVYLDKLNLLVEIGAVLNRISPLKKLVLYGADVTGKNVLAYLNARNISVDYFCDGYKQIESFCGIKVLKPLDLLAIKDEMQIIITSGSYVEIAKHLETIGGGVSSTIIGILCVTRMLDPSFVSDNQEKIDRVLSLFADQKSIKTFQNLLKSRLDSNPRHILEIMSAPNDQYFDREILKIDENEVFIDCGAYDGDTLKKFIEFSGNHFNKVVCFEPLKDAYKKLEIFAKSLTDDRISVYNLGLYDRKMIIGFNDNETGSAIDTNFSDNTIEVAPIDDFDICLTFLKMDIEGAELNALKGAEKSIIKYAPKLAICVYHNPSDFFEIPLFIYSLFGNSKRYFLRQYQTVPAETVFYAV